MELGRLAIIIVCALAIAGCSKPAHSAEHARDIFQSESARAVAAAACNGEVEALQDLIAGGADVNAAGRHGVTPLIWALTCHGLQFNDMIANEAVSRGPGAVRPIPALRQLAALEVLLAAGADPNAMIDGDFGPVYPGADAYWIDRYTPMLIAAEFHEPGVLALLLAHGGDPNAVHGGVGASALRLAYERGQWLDLGPQLAPFDDRQWRNMFMLLDAGARLELASGNQSNIVEQASAHRVPIAVQLLRRYEYTGDFDAIVYNLLNGIEMGFPGEQERLDLLAWLRDERGIDIEAIRARYWPPAPQRGP
ncbi:hypothetical protein L2D01_12420 [Hyphomonadaceae bacterium ML37]|nr:hypothetical protein L2D01_12420 [Hyphomonadaceae bacterium ML37]